MRISDLQQLADDCKNPLNDNDLVYWAELKQWMDAVNAELAVRGMTIVADVSVLPSLSGNNFKQVLVQNTGWFMFFADGFPDNITAFPADGGGVWLLIWSMQSQSLPDDFEITVTASGGIINNGDTVFSDSRLVNKRVRIYRNGTLLNSGDYTFNPTNGSVNLNLVASTFAIFSFQFY